MKNGFHSILTWHTTDHSHESIALYKRVHRAVVNTFERDCLVCVQLLFKWRKEMGFLNAILYLNQFEFEEKSRLTWVFGPMPNLSSEIPLEEEKFRSLDGFIMPSNNGHSRALKIALNFSMWADISALAIISTGDFILKISRCAGETSAVKWHPSEWIYKWKEIFVCVENYVAHIRMKNCINQKKNAHRRLLSANL